MASPSAAEVAAPVFLPIDLASSASIPVRAAINSAAVCDKSPAIEAPVALVDNLRRSFAPLAAANFFTLLFFICHIAAMSSAVYNPFLYAWMNENFKKEFHSVAPCLFPRGRASAAEVTSRIDSSRACSASAGTTPRTAHTRQTIRRCH